MGRGSGGRHQRGIGPREQNRQNRGEHRYGSTRGHAIMGTDDKPKDHTSTSDTTVITRPRVGFGTPIVRLNVTTETSLSDVLQAARSDWRGTKLTTVLNKLGKAQIETVSDLLTALRGRGNLHLNQRLEAVGEECFTGATLRVMLYQAEMLDRPSKTDAMSEIKKHSDTMADVSHLATPSHLHPQKVAEVSGLDTKPIMAHVSEQFMLSKVPDTVTHTSSAVVKSTEHFIPFTADVLHKLVGEIGAVHAAAVA